MRRRRFKFTGISPRTGERERIDSLVYDGVEHAIALLTERGWTEIEPFTEDKKPTWRVNRLGVEVIRRRWGIEWPVEIRRTAAVGSKGSCRTVYDRKRHYITTRRNAPLDEVERILRHELAHALDNEEQFREHGIKEAVRRDKLDMRRPYWVRRCEVFARSREETDLDVPLAFPT